MSDDDACRDYALVERAIARLVRARADQAPSLDDLAGDLGVSASKLQRTFSAWAGVSPKRLLQALSAERARDVLATADDVLGASLDAGASSPGRLHDLLVTVDAVTPGEARAGGRDLVLRWGACPTPFGAAVAVTTGRGLHRLDFAGDPGATLAALAADWPRATLREDPAAARAVAARVFAPGAQGPLHLWVRGTNFQAQVWRALLRIPAGRLVSYGDVARALGAPRAVRAVAGAIARNPVAVAIPCHRVLRREGALGGYRWGEARKLALIGREGCRGGP